MVDKHVSHLAHQVKRLVESGHQVAFTYINLIEKVRDGGPFAPRPGGPEEIWVVASRQADAVAPLGSEDGVLQVVQLTAQVDQVAGEQEAIEEVDVAVVGEPGEYLGYILRLEPLKVVPLDHLGNHQRVRVEDVR